MPLQPTRTDIQAQTTRFATHQLVIDAVQQVCIAARGLQLPEADRRSAEESKAPRNDLECLCVKEHGIGRPRACTL